MTTESKPLPTTVGTRVLLRSGGLGLTMVVVLAALAGAVGGSSGAVGALVGGAVALAVFVGGSLVVNLVAGIAPHLSLVFALMTYALQLLVVGLFFSAVRRSGAMDRTLDGAWIGAAIIAVTLVWLVAQIVLTTRARIPVYDLPSQAGER